MIDKRIQLHELLCTVLESRNCYFQPPENIKLTYPCIVYDLTSVNYKYADNKKYKGKIGYNITLIGNNLNPSFTDNLLKLDYCSYDRTYVSDNLKHVVFTIYY